MNVSPDFDFIFLDKELEIHGKITTKSFTNVCI